jgi:hypothetical protein
VRALCNFQAEVTAHEDVKPMRFLRQSLTGLFLCSVAIAVLLYAGDLIKTALDEKAARADRPSQSRERVFAVNVIAASPGTVRPVLTAFGDVKSRRTLEIRAALSGQVVELSENFVEGGQVAQGQLLGSILPILKMLWRGLKPTSGMPKPNSARQLRPFFWPTTRLSRHANRLRCATGCCSDRSICGRGVLAR